MHWFQKYLFAALACATFAAHGQVLMTLADEQFDEFGAPHAGAISPDGLNIYTVNGAGACIFVHEIDSVSGSPFFIEQHCEHEQSIGLDKTIAVAVSPDGKHVYAVNFTGHVSWTVFSRDLVTGELTWNETVEITVEDPEFYGASADGAGVIAISADGAHVYIVRPDYAIGVFERDATTGSLTEIQVFRDASGLTEADSLALSPDDENLYLTARDFVVGRLTAFTRATDTGLLTLLDVYTNDTGDIVDMVAPTAVTVSSDGKAVYVTSEDGALIHFARNDVDGSLAFQESIVDPPGDPIGLTGAEDVAVSPDGEQLYVLSSFNDAVVSFSRNTVDGEVTYTETQSSLLNPELRGLDNGRDVFVSLDSQIVHAMGASDSGVAMFDLADGFGSLTHRPGAFDVPGGSLATPSGIATNSTGDQTFVYVTAFAEDALIAYRLNEESGELTVIDGVNNRENEVVGLDGATDVQSLTLDGLEFILAVVSENSNSLSIYTRDVLTGGITAQQSVLFDGLDGVDGLDFPSSLAVGDFEGAQIYVTSPGDRAVSAFAVELGELVFKSMIQEGDPGLPNFKFPTGIAISPDGKNVYVADQDDLEDMLDIFSIIVFDRDLTTGALTVSQTVTEGVNGVSGIEQVTEVAVSLDGMSLYASGVTDGGSLAVFSRDLDTGHLTPLQVLKDGAEGVDGLASISEVTVSPDNVIVYVASQDDNSVSMFRRTSTFGRLDFLETQRNGLEGYTGLRAATDVAIDSSGEWAFASASDGNSLTAMKIFNGFGDAEFIFYVSDDELDIPRHVIKLLHPTLEYVRVVAFADDDSDIRTLPEGVYAARAWIPGFESVAFELDVTRNDSKATYFLLTPLSSPPKLIGVVRDTTGNRTLSGVKVTLRVAGEIVDYTYTGLLGDYEFSMDIPVDSIVEVNITFEYPNYVPLITDETLSGAVDGQLNLDVLLDRAGNFRSVFSGVVTTTAGKGTPTPVANATVAIQGPIALTTTTDMNGNYAFEDLPGGNYTVSAVATGLEVQTANWSVADGGVASKSIELGPEEAVVATDLDGDDSVNAIDIQIIINQVLGIPSGFFTDVNFDGATNAADIQSVINAVLGL